MTSFLDPVETLPLEEMLPFPATVHIFWMNATSGAKPSPGMNSCRELTQRTQGSFHVIDMTQPQQSMKTEMDLLIEHYCKKRSLLSPRYPFEIFFLSCLFSFFGGSPRFADPCVTRVWAPNLKDLAIPQPKAVFLPRFAHTFIIC